MRIPESLASLAEYGIIEEVLRPLMSGKEAQIYLVVSGGQQRVAKVYKEAQNRTFKNRADYTEGRKVRNTRDQRAMGKGSRHGKEQVEAAWRATEVEMIYRLRDAGVRVPVPYHFIDSVLVMEMITDAEGNPAPRLGDLTLEPDEARAIFERLLSEVVRMLSAGVVHGDLSDFNVLVGTDGPVIIDFPQAVDASSNQNARKLLLRDVDNLHRFMARFAPDYRALPYAQEMWQLYERSELAPDAKLTGRHRPSEQKANTLAVLALIGDANYDERKRRQGTGQKMRGVPNAPRAGDGRSDAPTAQATPRANARTNQQTRPDQESTVTPRRVEVVMTPATRRGPAAQRPGSGAEPRQGHSRQQNPRGNTGHDSRQRDGAPRDEPQRANPGHDMRTREPAPRQQQPRTQPAHDSKQREPAHDSRQREPAPRQQEQRADPGHDTRAREPAPRHQELRPNAGQDSRQRDFAPRQQAPRPHAEHDSRAREAMPRTQYDRPPPRQQDPRNPGRAHEPARHGVQPNTPTGAQASQGDGAQKRRRRRRRRKPGVDAPKTPS